MIELCFVEIVALNDINATVPVLLYRAVLPQMVERRNGLMLVMSSASAMSPQAVLPVYGSTKSYVLQLSRSLQVYLDEFDNSVMFRINSPTNIPESIFMPFNRNLSERQ